jgi:ketosteroid isomerase-like protein
MPEESTTPDLVALSHALAEAGNRHDLDAMMSFLGSEAVWETVGDLGATFEGVAAIRGFWQDWLASYEELWVEEEEVLDLGNGVAFNVLRQRGRPIGSSGYVQMRYAAVGVWREGLIERVTSYRDIDEARAAAERLAESRR